MLDELKFSISSAYVTLARSWPNDESLMIGSMADSNDWDGHRECRDAVTKKMTPMSSWRTMA